MKNQLEIRIRRACNVFYIILQFDWSISARRNRMSEKFLYDKYLGNSIKVQTFCRFLLEKLKV